MAHWNLTLAWAWCLCSVVLVEMSYSLKIHISNGIGFITYVEKSSTPSGPWGIHAWERSKKKKEGKKRKINLASQTFGKEYSSQPTSFELGFTCTPRFLRGDKRVIIYQCTSSGDSNNYYARLCLQVWACMKNFGFNSINWACIRLHALYLQLPLCLRVRMHVCK